MNLPRIRLNAHTAHLLNFIIGISLVAMCYAVVERLLPVTLYNPLAPPWQQPVAFVQLCLTYMPHSAFGVGVIAAIDSGWRWLAKPIYEPSVARATLKNYGQSWLFGLGIGLVAWLIAYNIDPSYVKGATPTTICIWGLLGYSMASMTIYMIGFFKIELARPA